MKAESAPPDSIGATAGRGTMNMNDSVMMKSGEPFIHVEFAGSLDECLRELSLMAGNALNAKGCAIALMSEREVEKIGLRPGAKFGELPRSRSRTQGSYSRAGHDDCRVAGTRGGIMPAEIGIDVRMRDKMFSAIVLEGKIIGVIHACQPQQRDCFSKDDLHLFSLLTLLITKSIQVIQLQNILKSRFAQIALTRTGEKTIGEIVLSSAQNPNHIARILAKSFYREMTSAGFDFNQIIYAASEVISELTGSLRKHSASRKHHVDKDGLRNGTAGRPGDPGSM
jgi:L-methionine (R)-S-oxide reductase